MSCLCPRCNTSDAAHPDCPGGHCGVASDPSSHQQYPGQLPSAARQPLHLEERVSGGDGEVRGCGKLCEWSGQDIVGRSRIMDDLFIDKHSCLFIVNLCLFINTLVNVNLYSLKC